jgi:hypothetical protein
MPATVIIERHTGTAGSTTQTNITGINTRANAFDTHSTNDTTNPIAIPPSGTNYSYWVSTRLECTVAPSGVIDNLRWFSDGANNFGTGVTCKVAKASTGANSGYRQATGTPGQTGTQLTQVNHTGLDAAPVDAFGKTSGSPLALTGSTSVTTTGGFGDFVVYQIEVASTASPGATAQETFTFQYDET